jgi:hypothetical protein
MNRRAEPRWLNDWNMGCGAKDCIAEWPGLKRAEIERRQRAGTVVTDSVLANGLGNRLSACASKAQPLKKPTALPAAITNRSLRWKFIHV